MTLILGFGNPLRGDEAVGWRVAERLNTAEALTDEPFAEIVQCGEPIFGLRTHTTTSSQKTAWGAPSYCVAPCVPRSLGQCG
jgi:hypothetical protein